MDMYSKITRRKMLATLGGISLSGILGYSILIEPNTFTLTKSQIKKENSNNKTHFVQISDLHLRAINELHKKIANTIIALKPDFIIVTGDSIDANGDYGLLDSFLKLFPKGLPKFSILGNWEHWAKYDIDQLDSIYKENNCVLLVNKSTILTIQNKDVLIAGLDDHTASHPSLKLALKNHLPRYNQILLQHSPEFVDILYEETEDLFTDSILDLNKIDLKSFKFDLMLSGNTHGGQIAPFGIAPLTPRGSGRYIKGWYKECNPQLFVSRGIGTSVIPIRFMSLPEIAFFEMDLI